jgi:hypothetical protein
MALADYKSVIGYQSVVGYQGHTSVIGKMYAPFSQYSAPAYLASHKGDDTKTTRGWNHFVQEKSVKKGGRAYGDIGEHREGSVGGEDIFEQSNH